MHHHHHHSAESSNRALGVAFWLTLGILGLEIGAGLRANSLALLSDAGHLVTDVFALGVAWFALRLSGLPPDDRKTFGYQRTGILAALANAGTLILVALVVTFEAIKRLQHPAHVQGLIVIGATAVGMLVNAYIVYSLHSGRETNLNVRAAFLHVVGDLAASAAVLMTGVAIAVWNVYILDPLLSIAIALLIAFGAWRILQDTVAILMESAPSGVELQELRDAMTSVPGVLDVHDLHVWSLSDGFRLLSAHISVPEQTLGEASLLLSDLRLVLRNRFHISHTTIEVECEDCQVPRRRPIELVQPQAANRSSS